MQSSTVLLKSVYVFIIALAAVLPMLAFGAYAGESSTKWQHGEVEALKRQVDELQRKIEEIESRQETRPAVTGDRWYDNIKGILRDESALTWESSDGNYRLRTRLRGQFLADFVDDDGDDSLGFSIRRARLAFDGHAFRPWFKYVMQMDFARNMELRDLYFDFAYNEQFVPRVGQYKPAFNREELTSSGALQLVDRSELNREFTFGRDIGVSAYGTFNRMIRYQVGIFQGEGINARADRGDSKVLWTGRVNVSPFGNDTGISVNFARNSSLALGFGIAGINASVDADGRLSDSNLGGAGPRIIDSGATGGQVISFTGDINFKHPMFNLEGEYIGRYIDLDDAVFSSVYDQGFRVQGGVFVVPDTIELAGRFVFISFDDDLDGKDKLWEITPGINYYLSKDHRWKIQLDYSFIREEDVSGLKEDTNRLRAQLQVHF